MAIGRAGFCLNSFTAWGHNSITEADQPEHRNVLHTLPLLLPALHLHPCLQLPCYLHYREVGPRGTSGSREAQAPAPGRTVPKSLWLGVCLT